MKIAVRGDRKLVTQPGFQHERVVTRFFLTLMQQRKRLYSGKNDPKLRNDFKNLLETLRSRGIQVQEKDLISGLRKAISLYKQSAQKTNLSTTKNQGAEGLVKFFEKSITTLVKQNGYKVLKDQRLHEHLLLKANKTFNTDINQTAIASYMAAIDNVRKGIAEGRIVAIKDASFTEEELDAARKQLDKLIAASGNSIDDIDPEKFQQVLRQRLERNRQISSRRTGGNMRSNNNLGLPLTRRIPREPKPIEADKLSPGEFVGKTREGFVNFRNETKQNLQQVQVGPINPADVAVKGLEVVNTTVKATGEVVSHCSENRLVRLGAAGTSLSVGLAFLGGGVMYLNHFSVPVNDRVAYNPDLVLRSEHRPALGLNKAFNVVEDTIAAPNADTTIPLIQDSVENIMGEVNTDELAQTAKSSYSLVQELLGRSSGRDSALNIEEHPLEQQLELRTRSLWNYGAHQVQMHTDNAKSLVDSTMSSLPRVRPVEETNQMSGSSSSQENLESN